LKIFIEDNIAYYEKGETLYHTQISSYGLFDTEDGSPVRESTDQLERIRRLVTENQLAQDVDQLLLF
jgi:hypothetical protein